MKTEFLVNGGVSLLIAPENEMEEQLLKQLAKQENDINEIRSSVIILNKTFRNGLFIGKKFTPINNVQDKQDNSSDESQQETV